MERQEACRLLGVGDDVDTTTLKRRFRELARDHHPDHGGDPMAFRDLRLAFAVLSDELAAGPVRPRRPSVSRGRPSREPDRTAGARSAEAVSLDAHGQELAGRLEEVGMCRYASRAPGARTNRVAASLSAASTSSLTIELVPSPDSDTIVAARIGLTARPRAARRAVTALDIARLSGAAWMRHRGDAVTALRTTLQGRGADAPPLAHRTAVAVVELLDALAWPLPDWTVAPPPSAVGRPAR